MTTIFNSLPPPIVATAGEPRPLEGDASKKELTIGHAQRVKVASRIATINIEQEEVQMRTITDRKILDAGYHFLFNIYYFYFH